MQTTHLAHYQNDAALIGEIMELLSPSYQTAGAHIAKDIELCEELYLIREEDGRLAALFMVGYHEIGNEPCCYLGLSACRNDLKNKGLVKSLYRRFAADCYRRGQETGTPIRCYFTTATPIVYHWFCSNFSGMQPDRNGVCSEEARKALLRIAKKKYGRAGIHENLPFVLRGAAEQVNYSAEERSRVAEAVRSLGLEVFEHFAIDETRGDRFLMCGYAPAPIP